MADVDLLGPFGALVLALSVIGGLVRIGTWLWNDHRASDARELERTQNAEARLDLALTRLKEHTDVTDRAVALTEKLVARMERGQ